MTVGQLIENLNEEPNKDKLVCVHAEIDGNDWLSPHFQLDYSVDDRFDIEVGTFPKTSDSCGFQRNLDRLSEFVKVAMNNRLFEVRKAVMDMLDILGVEITLRCKDDGCEDK